MPRCKRFDRNLLSDTAAPILLKGKIVPGNLYRPGKAWNSNDPRTSITACTKWPSQHLAVANEL